MLRAAVLGLVTATTVHAAAPVSVRLSPAAGSVGVTAPWHTTLTVRNGGRAMPRMVARLGSNSRAFTLRRTRPGVYRATVAVDSIGRWAISVIVARKTLRAGTLVATPYLTNVPDVALLPDGRLLVPDLANYVYAAAAGGALAVVAGNGRPGTSGDNGPATSAAVGFPTEVAVDPGGGFAIVQGDRVRRVAPDGGITTVATFASPTAIAYDADRDLFVSELGGLVRRVDARTGAVTTYAGADGGLSQPHGLVVDAEGNLFVCDVGNHRIRRVDRRTGEVTTVAAGLGAPVDVTIAPDGSLYVADFGENRIVRVANETVTPVVSGVGPNGVAVDAARSVYFTERTLPHVLRFDALTGRVSVVLGR
jgi:streptogramin lyase